MCYYFHSNSGCADNPWKSYWKLVGHPMKILNLPHPPQTNCKIKTTLDLIYIPPNTSDVCEFVPCKSFYMRQKIHETWDIQKLVWKDNGHISKYSKCNKYNLLMGNNTKVWRPEPQEFFCNFPLVDITPFDTFSIEVIFNISLFWRLDRGWWSFINRSKYQIFKNWNWSGQRTCTAPRCCM